MLFTMCSSKTMGKKPDWGVVPVHVKTTSDGDFGKLCPG